MDAQDRCWLVEQACTNAWPSRRQVFLDGWLLKASGGPSRRINSLNPLRAVYYDPAPALGDCEAIYRGLGQRLVVRAPDIAQGLSDRLLDLGFKAEAETCTLWADLSVDVGAEPEGIEVTARPNAGWLALRSSVNRGDPENDRVFGETLGGIALPMAFASLRVDDRPACIAFGVIDRRVLVIESVATHPQMRRRGLGRRTVAALLAWAAGQGAIGAALQVVADNAPARALYGTLGFGTELYRYAYWSRPEKA